MYVGKQEEDKLWELTAEDKPDNRAKSIHQTYIPWYYSGVEKIWLSFLGISILQQQN